VEVGRQLAAASEARRIPFQNVDKLRGIVPEWYHTALHTREYAVSQVAAHFRVLAYIAAGMGDRMR